MVDGVGRWVKGFENGRARYSKSISLKVKARLLSRRNQSRMQSLLAVRSHTGCGPLVLVNHRWKRGSRIWPLEPQDISWDGRDHIGLDDLGAAAEKGTRLGHSNMLMVMNEAMAINSDRRICISLLNR
jgi:hypothetical protein